MTVERQPFIGQQKSPGAMLRGFLLAGTPSTTSPKYIDQLRLISSDSIKEEFYDIAVEWS